MTDEYILSDSAITPRTNVVPQYKGTRSEPILDVDKAEFNSINAAPRVKVEHCIGIWKGRFPFLRSIRMRLTEKQSSIKRIHRYIHATVILHNLLIGWGDEEIFWDQKKREMDLEKLNNEEYIVAPTILDGLTTDRREKLHNYLVEKEAFAMLNFKRADRRRESKFYKKMNKLMDMK